MAEAAASKCALGNLRKRAHASAALTETHEEGAKALAAEVNEESTRVAQLKAKDAEVRRVVAEQQSVARSAAPQLRAPTRRWCPLLCSYTARARSPAPSPHSKSLSAPAIRQAREQRERACVEAAARRTALKELGTELEARLLPAKAAAAAAVQCRQQPVCRRATIAHRGSRAPHTWLLG